MANAELGTRVNISADRLWEIVAGEEISKMMLRMHAEHVEYGDDGSFTTTLKDGGGTTVEKLEIVDSDKKYIKYRLIDGGPFPYANYSGEMRVEQNGPDACVLSLRCEYIPVDMTEGESNQVWMDHNSKFFVLLKEYLAGN